MQPRNADWEAYVRSSFAQQGLMRHLGAQIDELAPGRCVLSCDFRPELSQQHGFFHAGVTSALADSAGGYAGFTLFPPESEVLTVEFKINLFAPARGRRIIATANVVKSGRTLTVCDIDVDVIDDAGFRTPHARMLQTLMRVTVAV